MKNIDFQKFTECISWFFETDDNLEFVDSKFVSSEIFKFTFPKLNYLMSKSRVLDIKLTSGNKIIQYKLYSWTSLENQNSGWLCKIENQEIDIKILEEHKILLGNIGGIMETYYLGENNVQKLTNNQKFLFTKSKCSKWLYWEDYYVELCKNERVQKIITTELVCFVVEANGNATYYDLENKQVFLFAPDHSFKNVEILDGQPEYTFYKIKGIENFTDYVEVLSQQWIDIIQ